MWVINLKGDENCFQCLLRHLLREKASVTWRKNREIHDDILCAFKVFPGIAQPLARQFDMLIAGHRVPYPHGVRDGELCQQGGHDG